MLWIIAVSSRSKAAVCNACRLLPKSELSQRDAQGIISLFFGKEGVESEDEAEAAGAFRALECLINDNARLFAPIAMPLIEQMLNRQEAEALSPSEIKIFETPEGLISSLH